MVKEWAMIYGCYSSVGKKQIKNGMPYMIRNTNGKDAINFRENIT